MTNRPLGRLFPAAASDRCRQCVMYVSCYNPPPPPVLSLHVVDVIDDVISGSVVKVDGKSKLVPIDHHHLRLGRSSVVRQLSRFLTDFVSPFLQASRLPHVSTGFFDGVFFYYLYSSYQLMSCAYSCTVHPKLMCFNLC